VAALNTIPLFDEAPPEPVSPATASFS